ncbi:MAG: uracil-DNA glycosylase [Acidimicrobiales bacterium]
MSLPHPAIGGDFPSPVPPGTGWPGDQATSWTPVAHDARQVATLATDVELAELTARSSVCRACPRLVLWRERVASTKRRSFADEPYWGRPVPGWGDPDAYILIVGLAPAAHGGNRTGRVFTGDRSGDWLFAALHRAGLANQPTSTHAGDGLRLDGVWITAAVRCAPPGNRPTPQERETCAPFLGRELALLRPRVVICLGAFAFTAACSHYGVRPRPRFGHSVDVAVADGPVLLASYHPSQQNTFTGKLTEVMLDSIIAWATAIARE